MTTLHSKPFYDTIEHVIDLWYNKMEISETVCRIVLMYILQSHGQEDIVHGLDPVITGMIDKFAEQSHVEYNQRQ